MTSSIAHKNLQLVRQLFEQLVLDLCDECLNDGYDFALEISESESADLVGDRLRKLAHLASDPVPKFTSGRGREQRREFAQSKRNEVALFVRIALALVDPESLPESVTATTAPAHPPKAGITPLPESVPELMRTMAIKLACGSGSTKRSRPLWSKPFPAIGLGDDLVVRLRPDLALEIAGSSSGRVLMRTVPVQFGPLASDDKALAERFEQWCADRRDDPTQPPAALPNAAKAGEGEPS